MWAKYAVFASPDVTHASYLCDATTGDEINLTSWGTMEGEKEEKRGGMEETQVVTFFMG